MALICQSWFILKILRIWSCLAVADEFAYMHPITTAVHKLYVMERDFYWEPDSKAQLSPKK